MSYKSNVMYRLAKPKEYVAHDSTNAYVNEQVVEIIGDRPFYMARGDAFSGSAVGIIRFEDNTWKTMKYAGVENVSDNSPWFTATEIEKYLEEVPGVELAAAEEPGNFNVLEILHGSSRFWDDNNWMSYEAAVDFAKHRIELHPDMEAVVVERKSSMKIKTEMSTTEF